MWFREEVHASERVSPGRVRGEGYNMKIPCVNTEDSAALFFTIDLLHVRQQLQTTSHTVHETKLVLAQGIYACPQPTSSMQYQSSEATPRPSPGHRQTARNSSPKGNHKFQKRTPSSAGDVHTAFLPPRNPQCDPAASHPCVAPAPAGRWAETRLREEGWGLL